MSFWSNLPAKFNMPICSSFQQYGNYTVQYNKGILQKKNLKLICFKIVGIIEIEFEINFFFTNTPKLLNLEKNELQIESGCRRPCSYMEYKVRSVT